MTLTTERLKWLHDAATELSATKLKMTMRPDELLVLTSELLANREAQPVDGELGEIRVGRLPTMNQEEYPGLGDWWVQLRIGASGDEFLARVYGATPDEAVARARALTAPPAPAATTPISFSENADDDMCRELAWKQVKELLTPDGWTVGDNITYFGFFCLGWDMRQKYNEQRPPAPAVPEEAKVGEMPFLGNGEPGYVRGWNDCRAAMLAQPVSQRYTLPDGFKLMPLEMTDEIGEAIAMEARCCGGIALCIYEAALAAAPEGGNG
ncbi:hypothetical protein OI978_24345 [Serratia nevei]|uniref:hypothetical protein n=1 Tax=Serratia nevei TaxID=2703794 RepID=UPI0025432C6B|nr:hypothetical protein [Serratia nevei]WIJ63898.1 hypothetical protein OI978_24345 [Serratia nevei]